MRDHEKFTLWCKVNQGLLGNAIIASFTRHGLTNLMLSTQIGHLSPNHGRTYTVRHHPLVYQADVIDVSDVRGVWPLFPL